MNHTAQEKKGFWYQGNLAFEQNNGIVGLQVSPRESSLWICQLETIEHVLKECPVDSV